MLAALVGVLLIAQSQSPGMDFEAKEWQLVAADGGIVAQDLTVVECAKLKYFRSQTLHTEDRCTKQ